MNCTHLNISLSVSVISRLWHDLKSFLYLHSMFNLLKTSDSVIFIKFYSWKIKIFAVDLSNCTHLKITLSVSVISRL